MVIYSIKDIEDITGIKAHTLRIWEKRYDIIKPQRTKTNIRYYTDENLKHILNISYLNKNGIKISHIAKMEKEEIQQQVAVLTNTQDDLEQMLDSLTLAVIDLNEKSVNRIIDTYLRQKGYIETMRILIDPFMEKLSALWISGSIKAVHESFISEILKHKTIQQFALLEDISREKSPHVMLFLPKGEKQELSLLYFRYRLHSIGVKTTLAGFELSLKDVLDAAAICNPSHLYSIYNEDNLEQSFATYIQYICSTLENCTFLISGYKAATIDFELPKNCMVISELNKALEYFNIS